ncbi:MAG: alpha-hydroxy-acid oxidizing protein [Alicyclobacillus sp.]|nr:alpha-hydroxy-acid oxidizing protein [Alicyclobacillus sp.]
MTTYGLDAQLQIYRRMLEGKTYDEPLSWETWRERARQTLAPGPWGYLEGAAGAEETMASNRRAFQQRFLRPRMLRNVADRDLSIQLLGVRYPLPFLFAPIGVQSILHPDAEAAPARVAARHGVPFIVSTVSSLSMEQIAHEMGDAPRWFQLYPGKDPAIVDSFVHRAEAAGYGALVVTVDTTMLGWRMSDLRNAYLPFLQGEGIANFRTDPVFQSRLATRPEDDPAAAVEAFLDVYVNPAFTWSDLRRIRNTTRLPMLIKGITHPEDARMALDAGADGVIVSNHGGRQVDGAVATLDALAEIREALGPEPLLLMDSGVRTAADILKAKAVGANAVLIGRPYAYALAAGGAAAIETWLLHLRAELDLEMALAGYPRYTDIGPDFVTNRTAVPKR